MDTLRWLVGLKPGRVQPPTIETDDVYPAHFLDDTKNLKSMILSWTLRFDDVLDADNLHDALVRLLQIGDWKKLGGRLRLTSDGKLVIHVPKEFTSERPGVRYSHDVFDVTVDEHPLASQLPEATSYPSVQPELQTFRSFGARNGAPTTFEDFLYSDEPQLSLHITSFKDATLVGILFPHTMTDAMGLAALMNAWTLVVAGRENEVPPLQGAREDVLDGVGTKSDPIQEPYILEPYSLTGFKLVRFGLNLFWDLYWSPRSENRMLYLPASFVSELRQRAASDLKAISGNAEPPFISEGDTLSAWAARLVAQSEGKGRPITVINAVNIRPRLTSVLQAGSAYVQNLALGTFEIFSAQELTQSSLGQVARKFRTDIDEQITEPQIKALLRDIRATGTGGLPTMYGETNSLLVIMSNWTKADFFGIIDFSPVVTSVGVNGASHQPGKIIYQYPELMVPNAVARNVFNIVGKDLSGGYWVAANFPPGWWAKAEEDISRAAAKGHDNEEPF